MTDNIEIPKDLPARALEVLSYLISKKEKGAPYPNRSKISKDLSFEVDYPIKLLTEEGVVKLHVINRAHHYEVLITRPEFNQIKIRTTPKIKLPERGYYRPDNGKRPFPLNDPRWPKGHRYENVGEDTANADKIKGKAHLPSKSYSQTLGGTANAE